MKYAYSAPDRGTTALSSANARAPRRDKKPQMIQMIKQRPTDPERSKALVGDMKIPEPVSLYFYYIILGFFGRHHCNFNLMQYFYQQVFIFFYCVLNILRSK